MDGTMVQTSKMFYMQIPMKNAVKYVSILIVVRPLRKFQVDRSSSKEQIIIDWIKIWLENERLLPDQQ